MGHGGQWVVVEVHYPACFSIGANHIAIEQMSLGNVFVAEAMLFKNLPKSITLKRSFVAIPLKRDQVVDDSVYNFGDLRIFEEVRSNWPRRLSSLNGQCSSPVPPGPIACGCRPGRRCARLGECPSDDHKSERSHTICSTLLGPLTSSIIKPLLTPANLSSTT
jgi:hypothetical protein